MKTENSFSIIFLELNLDRSAIKGMRGTFVSSHNRGNVQLTEKLSLLR